MTHVLHVSKNDKYSKIWVEDHVKMAPNCVENSGIILTKFCKSSKPKVCNVIDEKTTALITSSHSSNKIDNLAVHG